MTAIPKKSHSGFYMTSVCLLLLLISNALSAQLNPKTHYIGGFVSAYAGETEGVWSYSFDFSETYGYYFLPWFSLGLDARIQNQVIRYGELNQTKSTTLDFSATSRFIFAGSLEKSYVSFIQLNAGAGMGNISIGANDDEFSSIGYGKAGIGAGMSIFFTEQVSMDLLLDYNRLISEDIAVEAIGLNQVQFRLGISYYYQK